jgi:hypothetical protein
MVLRGTRFANNTGDMGAALYVEKVGGGPPPRWNAGGPGPPTRLRARPRAPDRAPRRRPRPGARALAPAPWRPRPGARALAPAPWRPRRAAAVAGAPYKPHRTPPPRPGSNPHAQAAHYRIYVRCRRCRFEANSGAMCPAVGAFKNDLWSGGAKSRRLFLDLTGSEFVGARARLRGSPGCHPRGTAALCPRALDPAGRRRCTAAWC